MELISYGFGTYIMLLLFLQYLFIQKYKKNIEYIN